MAFETKITGYKRLSHQFETAIEQAVVEMVNDLRNQLRMKSPLGILGALQRSWKIEPVSISGGDVTGGVYSDLEYASIQNDEELYHVPEYQSRDYDIYERSFRDYDPGGGRVANRGAKYQRGYRFGIREGIATPYKLNYVELAMEAAEVESDNDIINRINEFIRRISK